MTRGGGWSWGMVVQTWCRGLCLEKQTDKFKNLDIDYIQRMTKQTLEKYYVLHAHQVLVIQILTETFFVHFLIRNFLSLLIIYIH